MQVWQSVTQVAAAAAASSWLVVERVVRGKASVLVVLGAVAGLAVITPAAGFVGVGGAGDGSDRWRGLLRGDYCTETPT
ncbi:MAG: hypothetical protein U1F01_03600 [Acinetobacter sp.]